MALTSRIQKRVEQQKVKKRQLSMTDISDF